MELNKKKNFNKKGNNKVKSEPVYDAFQKEIANDLKDQAAHFLDQYIVAKANDRIRDLEKGLFQLGAYPLMAGEAYPNLALYTVERFIRSDRETHAFIRATTSIIVLNTETNAPAYFISAYLTQSGGRITVTPMGDRGPIGRNTYNLKVTSDMVVSNDKTDDDATETEESESTAE